MKKIMILATIVAMAGIMSSCGSSKQASSAVSVTDEKAMQARLGAPAEVEEVFPCSGIDSDEEFLRVNGLGKSKDRKMARDRAYNDALAQLSIKLAGVAATGRNENAVSANAGQEDFHDKVVTTTKIIAKENVAGYRTSCEKFTFNKTDNSHNCYVTIEFGKQKIVKKMYEALQKNGLIKADYDFDRYMEAFEKDLQEYEKAKK